MSRLRVVLVAIIGTGGIGESPLLAQSAADLSAAGVRAYQDLELEPAERFFRRALAVRSADSLALSARANTLMYLGATEMFLGRRDSAAATFRRLVTLAPRYQPDQLVFPPQVSDLFRDTRRDTKAVAAVLPAERELRVGRDQLVVNLFASAYHRVTAAVTREDGAVIQAVYDGPIGDSLAVGWDGLTGSGDQATGGRYQFRITSTDFNGEVYRELHLPFRAVLQRQDTLPLPFPLADSLLLPEHTPGARPALAVAGTLLAAAAGALLPTVVASEADASSARFVVVSAISITGLIGLIVKPSGRPIAPNIESNRLRRDTWEQRRSEVIAENARRRADVRLHVSFDPPRRIEPESR